VRGIAALGLLGPLLVSAQTLYKCGNTYSQTPCSDTAQPVRVFTTPAPKAEPGARGFALCAAQLPAEDAARARQQGTRRVEVIRYADQPLSAQRFDLVLPPQEAGAPTARYACWLSEDQARLLQFEPVGSR
jgi:hypothetical protein